jgi:hypothetical protein
MKSIYHGTAAANCKLRGKKFHLLSCRCCALINVKDQVEDRCTRKEIDEFKKNIASVV